MTYAFARNYSNRQTADGANIYDLTSEASNSGASNSGVTAGTYTNPTITVDATGRVTSASTGSSNSGVTAGTYTNSTITVDATGRVTSASSGSSGSGINVIAKGIATSSGNFGNLWQFSSMTGCTGTSLNISSTNSSFRITLNTANSGAVVNLMPSTSNMSVSGRSYTFTFNNAAAGSYHFIVVG